MEISQVDEGHVFSIVQLRKTVLNVFRVFTHLLTYVKYLLYLTKYTTHCKSNAV